jgi:hypothetical protein
VLSILPAHSKAPAKDLLIYYMKNGGVLQALSYKTRISSPANFWDKESRT